MRRERAPVGAVVLTGGWGLPGGRGTHGTGRLWGNSSTSVPPSPHHAANSFEKMGQKKADLFLLGEGGANSGLRATRLCDTGQRVLPFSPAAPASGPPSDAVVSDSCSQVAGAAPVTAAANLRCLALARSSHIFDNACQDWKRGTGSNFITFKKSFFIISGFKLNIAIYLPAKFEDC